MHKRIFAGFVGLRYDSMLPVVYQQDFYLSIYRAYYIPSMIGPRLSGGPIIDAIRDILRDNSTVLEKE